MHVPKCVARNEWTAQEFRRAARLAAGLGARRNTPVVVVPGGFPPTLVGEQQHYTTRTGLPIRFPSAYRKRGRSSMVYVPSSLRVVVGDRWRPEVQ